MIIYLRLKGGDPVYPSGTYNVISGTDNVVLGADNVVVII